MAPASTGANANLGSGRLSTKAGGALAVVPWVLVSLVALYVVWAVVEQHQRVKNQIEPKNIGINLRNLAVIMVPVILGLNLFKIVAVKYKAWGLPGGDVLVTLAGGA